MSETEPARAGDRTSEDPAEKPVINLSGSRDGASSLKPYAGSDLTESIRTRDVTEKIKAARARLRAAQTDLAALEALKRSMLDEKATTVSELPTPLQARHRDTIDRWISF
jgi:hypothetical protein